MSPSTSEDASHRCVALALGWSNLFDEILVS